MGVVQHTARRMVVSSTVLAFLSIGISVKAQMLDRKCFGSENGTLSDTFLASPVDEEAQAVVYGGERAFSVNLVKALFKNMKMRQSNKISSFHHLLSITH